MWKNHNYYHVKMPKEHDKILKYNQDQKFRKIPIIIYTHTENMLKKYNYVIKIHKIIQIKKKKNKKCS